MAGEMTIYNFENHHIAGCKNFADAWAQAAPLVEALQQRGDGEITQVTVDADLAGVHIKYRVDRPVAPSRTFEFFSG